MASNQFRGSELQLASADPDVPGGFAEPTELPLKQLDGPDGQGAGFHLEEQAFQVPKQSFDLLAIQEPFDDDLLILELRLNNLILAEGLIA